MKNGEQERENLRIEAQRLRDELSDLKIEADIINEKLRNSSANANRGIRKPTPLGPGLSVPHSPDHSPGTSASSPIIATPPAKSISSATSDAVTPPSPPVSESSAHIPKVAATPSMPKPRMSVTETGSVARHQSTQKPRHSRGPSIPVSNGRSTPSVTSRRSYARMDYNQPSGLPRSGSLYQIRGLIGKMQKLEERVHSARSRLPAPVDTPPRASPRSGSALGQNSTIPSTVTMRSSRKRTGGSNASSSLRDSGATATYTPSRSSLGGIPQPSRSIHGGDSRPSSRTSMSSRSSISGVNSGIPARPDSRQSVGGARTPLGHYSMNPTTESRRPRSSLSNYGNHSMSHIDEGDGDLTTPTPRRSTYNKNDFAGTAIPTPSGLKKRPSQTGVSGIAGPRRISSGLDRRDGEMAPPERRKKLSGVGETY